MSGILLAGGAGYIGSHTAAELLRQGREVVILDDLSNADASVYEALEAVTGRRARVYTGEVQYRSL